MPLLAMDMLSYRCSSQEIFVRIPLARELLLHFENWVV
jgi:hypothetical protein